MLFYHFFTETEKETAYDLYSGLVRDLCDFVISKGALQTEVYTLRIFTLSFNTFFYILTPSPFSVATCSAQTCTASEYPLTNIFCLIKFYSFYS